MTSGYQGYYDSYQYNQSNYSYSQEAYSQVTTYPEQPPPPPPSNTQYQQPAYNQSSQYQALCPTNDFANQPNYGTAYNQNNTRYTGGQYTTLNTNGTQFQSSNTTYGQYLTNDNETNSSYGYAQNSFSNTNNAAYSTTPTNYSTFNQATGAKDFNQNATNYGQRTTDNTGYVPSPTGYADTTVYGQNSAYGQTSANYQVNSNLNTATNTAYGQTSAVGNGYSQTSGQYASGQFGQNQYQQRKQNGVPAQGGDYSDFKFDSQPPPPPPSHVQQTPRSGSFAGNEHSRFQESRGRSQMFDRGSRGRGAGDHYHTRGQGSSRVNRGGHNTFGGQYSHNQTETPRPFNSRGNRGRYGNQSSNRGNSRGGFTRPRDNIPNKDSLPNSDELVGCDVKSRSNPGKENVPKITVNETSESLGSTVTESQSPPSSYVIPPAALMGAAGDQPPNPYVEAKLRELMQPLYCRLCSVNLNATSQAQQHYEGKNHAKKVRMFLASSSATSPEKESPIVDGTTDQSEDSDVLKEKTKEKVESAPLDEEVYCKICDVSFTSVKQSTQHYQGKNHAKKVRLAAAANITTPSDTVVKGEGSQFECLMCNVHVTSQEQLNMHINGAKHKNKLRLQQRSAQALQGRWVGADGGGGWGHVSGGGVIEVTGRAGGAGRGFKRQFGKGNSWSTFDDNSRNFQPSGPKRPRQDFSNYRTPSGKFYCSSCNVTLNVESQFAQHVASKRHKTNHAMQRNSSDQTDTH